jgi:hypothetical protein
MQESQINEKNGKHGKATQFTKITENHALSPNLVTNYFGVGRREDNLD